MNCSGLAVGTTSDKESLFALFGRHADDARKLYDSNGDQTFDELKRQIFADKTMTEPTRYLADIVARAGLPVWLYRFSYAAQALRSNPAWKGTLHGFEIPYTFYLPTVVVKDKVTASDKAMAALASAYWVSFGQTGDPNGGGRPQWPRHEAGADKIINFTNDGVVIGPDHAESSARPMAEGLGPEGYPGLFLQATY